MENQKKDFSNKGTESCQVGRFGRELEKVSRQIAIERFDEDEKIFALQIAKIITEVMMLNGDGESRIGRTNIPNDLIRETFTELTHEQIKRVIKRYRALDYTVSNKKCYLRTALYNAAFEPDDDEDGTHFFDVAVMLASRKDEANDNDP